MNEIPPKSKKLFFLRFVVAIGAIFYLTPSTGLMFYHQVQHGFDWIEFSFESVSFALTVMCWGFALRGHLSQSRDRMRFSLIGGFLFLFIGFVGGVIGPILFFPTSNQGPLLGVFVAGPLGLSLGTLIGWLYSLVYFHKKKDIV